MLKNDDFRFATSHLPSLRRLVDHYRSASQRQLVPAPPRYTDYSHVPRAPLQLTGNDAIFTDTVSPAAIVRPRGASQRRALSGGTTSNVFIQNSDQDVSSATDGNYVLSPSFNYMSVFGFGGGTYKQVVKIVFLRRRGSASGMLDPAERFSGGFSGRI